MGSMGKERGLHGGVGYDPTHDGPVGHYLDEKAREGIPPLFKGIEDFKMLCNLGLVWEGITYVRVMFNYARGDGHYGVVKVGDQWMLQGVDVGPHSGDSGTHDPKMILKTKADRKFPFYFEIHDLNYDKLQELIKKEQADQSQS